MQAAAGIRGPGNAKAKKRMENGVKEEKSVAERVDEHTLIRWMCH